MYRIENAQGHMTCYSRTCDMLHDMSHALDLSMFDPVEQVILVGISTVPRSASLLRQPQLSLFLEPYLSLFTSSTDREGGNRRRSKENTKKRPQYQGGVNTLNALLCPIKPSTLSLS